MAPGLQDTFLEQKMCTNCHKTDSSETWRVVKNLTYCNACGIYLRDHNVQRPQRLVEQSAARRATKRALQPVSCPTCRVSLTAYAAARLPNACARPKDLHRMCSHPTWQKGLEEAIWLNPWLHAGTLSHGLPARLARQQRLAPAHSVRPGSCHCAVPAGQPHAVGLCPAGLLQLRRPAGLPAFCARSLPAHVVPHATLCLRAEPKGALHACHLQNTARLAQLPRR